MFGPENSFSSNGANAIQEISSKNDLPVAYVNYDQSFRP